MRAFAEKQCSTLQVVRVSCITLAAIAVIALAMAIKGWQWASLLLGVALILMAGLLVMQISRAMLQMRSHSATLSQAAADAEHHYISVLRRLVKFIEAGDKYSRGRSDRIGKLAEVIARKMGLPDKTCQLMGVAGQLHDIGQLAIPERILSKRSMPCDDFRTVQRHSEISYEVLRPLTSLTPVLPAVRYHHERMNGTGYPAALAGADIPMEARILAVADAYDAMTHDRPHRPALSPLEAMREMRRCTPAGYDEACVGALAEVVNLQDLESAASGRANAAKASPREQMQLS